MNETTRIDGPWIVGEMKVFLSPTTALAHITHDTNHSVKPNSSPLVPPEPDMYLGPLSSGTFVLTDGTPIYTEDQLREVARRNREIGKQRGRDEVAGRLPRLWGEWHRGKWSKNSRGNAVFVSEPDAIYSEYTREFDPRTGRPKG